MLLSWLRGQMLLFWPHNCHPWCWTQFSFHHHQQGLQLRQGGSDIISSQMYWPCFMFGRCGMQGCRLLQQSIPPTTGLRTSWYTHTFVESQVPFHLNHDLSFKRSTVDDMAAKFKIPGLCHALAGYIVQVWSSAEIFALGGWCVKTGNLDHELPFSLLEVWVNFCLQLKGYHIPYESLPAQTINAFPPPDTWPLGWFDPVIFNTDPQYKWPHSRITGNVSLFLFTRFQEWCE